MTIKYPWEDKAQTILEHLHKGTTPEDLLELMLRFDVFDATEEEKTKILNCVYSCAIHVYFGGTWDPVEQMKRKPGEGLKEIKEYFDRLVEDGKLSKVVRDKRWKAILKDCNRYDLVAEFHKKEYERIELLLKAAMK